MLGVAEVGRFREQVGADGSGKERGRAGRREDDEEPHECDFM
jgi:hypothetical protein